jgi:hypothetical protein
MIVWFSVTYAFQISIVFSSLLSLAGYLNDGDPRTFPTLEALARSKPRTLKQPILTGEI